MNNMNSMTSFLNKYSRGNLIITIYFKKFEIKSDFWNKLENGFSCSMDLSAIWTSKLVYEWNYTTYFLLY